MNIKELILSEISKESKKAKAAIDACANKGVDIIFTDEIFEENTSIKSSFVLDEFEVYTNSGSTIPELAIGFEYIYDNNLSLAF
ncbi:MAG: hypothetical protein ACEQSR_16365 [Candidatus Methylacidiphilales bacterium]